jgi:hypothetical protein
LVAKTAVAVLLFMLLSLAPGYLLEHLTGVEIGAIAVVGLFLLAVPIAIAVIGLIVFCCNREVTTDHARIEVPRPPWQPAAVFAFAVPSLVVALGDPLKLIDIAYLAWVGAALGGSAGLANFYIPEMRDNRNA